MKRILLSILVIGILLLSACGASTTMPETETPSTPKTEQPTPITYTLSITVSPSGAGSVSPSDGQYDEGTQVTLTATPASGYTFVHWSGDATGTSSSVTITMDSAKSVTAHFKAQYTLSTSVSPGGSGTVSPVSGTYDAGTEVTLTATPASGYAFDHWGGDASGSVNPIAITVTSNNNLIAYFTAVSSSWTISASEAQQAVQDMLDVISHIIPIYDERGNRVGWPKLPSGVDMPTDGQAGTPKLVERNGIPAYEVPVLSNGKRIGEIYVKQNQSTRDQIEFIN